MAKGLIMVKKFVSLCLLLLSCVGASAQYPDKLVVTSKNWPQGTNGIGHIFVKQGNGLYGLPNYVCYSNWGGSWSQAMLVYLPHWGGTNTYGLTIDGSAQAGITKWAGRVLGHDWTGDGALTSPWGHYGDYVVPASSFDVAVYTSSPASTFQWWYVHNEVSDEWFILPGDEYSPTNGPNGSYDQRTFDDSGVSCAPYPWSYANRPVGWYDYWPSADTNAVPYTNSLPFTNNAPLPLFTNSPPVVSSNAIPDVPVVSPESWQNPSPAPGSTSNPTVNVDLSAVYVYLQQVRDSVSRADADVVNNLNRNFVDLRRESAGAHVESIKALGDIENKLGTGNSYLSNIVEHTLSISSALEAITNGWETNEMSWLNPDFQSDWDVQTNGVGDVTYTRLNGLLEEWERASAASTNGVNNLSSPTWFLRTWGTKWKLVGVVTVGGVSQELGINLDGDNYAGARTALTTLRGVFLWGERFLYWFSLWLTYIWMFGGGRHPLS